MSDSKCESGEAKFTLKVFIDKEKNKVLYAEANNHFADILLSFLTLPLGCIVRHCRSLILGSLTRLYIGLEALKVDHFWTDGAKRMLLEPRNSFSKKLEPCFVDVGPAEYYTCGDMDCNREGTPYVAVYYDTMKCRCGRYLDKEMGTANSENHDDVVFIQKRTSVFITDELQMMTSMGYLICSRVEFGSLPGVEQRIVVLGSAEIRSLLELCLVSKTPLTDFIIKKKGTVIKFTGKLRLMHPIVAPIASISNSKKMIVKAFMRKSTNKLLFAQAEDDFVDFLFSFLTIPLGAVEWLLAGNSMLGSIDELYKSAAELSNFYINEDNKKQLLKPDLPPMYLSKNQIFPLSEQMATKLYYHESITDSNNRRQERGCFMRLKDPKGEGTYIKGPGVFMVTDDLTVTPLCTSSILSILKKMEIPLSDVEEMKLKVGAEEALGILKASLTSICALTDGLIVPMLNEQKQHE